MRSGWKNYFTWLVLAAIVVIVSVLVGALPADITLGGFLAVVGAVAFYIGVFVELS